MSKKKPLDQLSRLFAVKEKTINDFPEASMQPSGWSWELDNEHRYIFCDPEVRQTLGYSSERLIGQPLESIGIAHDSIPTVKFIFNEDLFPVEVDVICISQNGKQIPARLTVFKKKKSQTKEGDTFSWSGFTQPLVVSKPNSTQAKNLSDLKGSNKTHVRTIKSTGLPAELSGKKIRDLPLAVHEDNTPEITDEDHEVSDRLTSPDRSFQVEDLSGEIHESKLSATDDLLNGLINKIKKTKDKRSIYNLLDEFIHESLEIDNYAFIHFDLKQKLLLFPISREGGVANQPDAIPMGIDLYSWAVIIEM